VVKSFGVPPSFPPIPMPALERSEGCLRVSKVLGLVAAVQRCVFASEPTLERNERWWVLLLIFLCALSVLCGEMVFGCGSATLRLRGRCGLALPKSAIGKSSAKRLDRDKLC
jgi:hypothetical protein